MSDDANDLSHDELMARAKAVAADAERARMAELRAMPARQLLAHDLEQIVEEMPKSGQTEFAKILYEKGVAAASDALAEITSEAAKTLDKGMIDWLLNLTANGLMPSPNLPGYAPPNRGYEGPVPAAAPPPAPIIMGARYLWSSWWYEETRWRTLGFFITAAVAALTFATKDRLADLVLDQAEQPVMQIPTSLPPPPVYRASPSPTPALPPVDQAPPIASQTPQNAPITQGSGEQLYIPPAPSVPNVVRQHQEVERTDDVQQPPPIPSTLGFAIIPAGTHIYPRPSMDSLPTEEFVRETEVAIEAMVDIDGRDIMLLVRNLHDNRVWVDTVWVRKSDTIRTRIGDVFQFR